MPPAFDDLPSPSIASSVLLSTLGLVGHAMGFGV
jgi:hypothetical protein